MPWLEPPVPPCKHTGRPLSSHLSFTDRGRIWQCATCQQKFKVIHVDFGHDVMPGEASWEMRWECLS